MRQVTALTPAISEAEKVSSADLASDATLSEQPTCLAEAHGPPFSSHCSLLPAHPASLRFV